MSRIRCPCSIWWASAPGVMWSLQVSGGRSDSASGNRAAAGAGEFKCLKHSDSGALPQAGFWADLGTGSPAPSPSALGRSLASTFRKDMRWRSVPDAPDFWRERESQNTWRLRTCWTLHLRQLVGAACRPWWGACSHLVLSAIRPTSRRTLIHGLEPVVRDHEPHLALSWRRRWTRQRPCRHVIGCPQGSVRRGDGCLIEHHHDQSDAVVAC